MGHPTGISAAKTLQLDDGRVLSYAEYGDPAGVPVVGLHGLPGSRLMLKVAEPAAHNRGIRLIAPERPGYGSSSALRPASVAQYAADVAALADALKLPSFAILGVSGGGPYALACASQLAARVSLALLISGIGPLYLPDSTRDMVSANRIMFAVGRFSPALAGLLLPQLIRSSLPSLEKHVRNGTSPSPDIDPAAFAILAADQREAIRAGGKGIHYDMANLWRPWGFRLDDVRVEVHLWHGEADNLAPIALARHIADKLPRRQAVFLPGAGHTDPLTKHMDEILSRAIEAWRRT